MARYVQLTFTPDVDSWEENAIWGEDGVLAGLINLRLRGTTILSFSHHGLNSTAVSLARSITGNHRGLRVGEDMTRAPWPLFLCAGALTNRCGVLVDWDITHADGMVLMTNFTSDTVPRATHLVVPWVAWAESVVKFGTRVLRRLPERPPHVTSEARPQYEGLRSELRALLKHGRAQLRSRLRGA